VQKNEYLPAVRKNFLFRGVDEELLTFVLGHPDCGIEAFSQGDIIFDKHHNQKSLGVIVSAGQRFLNRPEATRRF
jgi:hypothetical protein